MSTEAQGANPQADKLRAAAGEQVFEGTPRAPIVPGHAPTEFRGLIALWTYFCRSAEEHRAALHVAWNHDHRYVLEAARVDWPIAGNVSLRCLSSARLHA